MFLKSCRFLTTVLDLWSNTCYENERSFLNETDVLFLSGFVRLLSSKDESCESDLSLDKAQDLLVPNYFSTKVFTRKIYAFYTQFLALFLQEKRLSVAMTQLKI